MVVAMSAWAHEPPPIVWEPTLVAQLRAQQRLDDPGLRITLHRLRPGLRVTWPDRGLGAFVQFNTTPGVLEVLDVGVTARHGRWKGVLGQLKTPFTRYRLRSFASMTLSDWAISSRAFGNERQLGASGAFTGSNVLVNLGVFAGANQRSAHRVRLAELYGGPGPNPSSLTDPGPATTSIGPEGVASFTVHTAGVDLAHARTDEPGWQGFVSVSLAHDVQPQRGVDFSSRFALEGVVQHPRLALWTVGYAARAPLANRAAWAMTGALAEVDLGLWGSWSLSGRLAGTWTTEALRADVPDDRALPWRREAEIGGAIRVDLHQALQVLVDVRREARAFAARTEGSTVAQLQLLTAI